jgi:hypothetical protein
LGQGARLIFGTLLIGVETGWRASGFVQSITSAQKEDVHFACVYAMHRIMFPAVDTKNASAVLREVEAVYSGMFPKGDADFVSKAFTWALDSFGGKYDNYQAIDARYHDLEHTMQGTLCFARLLQGYQRARVLPELTEQMTHLGLLAILLHDTGYLKTRGDNDGTGAKYTLIHVNRSCEFAAKLLEEKGFSRAEIKAVQNMIRCTGVNVDLEKIPFASEEERMLGYALGTADLLGQMAADDYVDKLEILFSEFEESARHNGKFTGAGAFSSAQDLRTKTPLFWEKYVLPKIEGDFRGLYRYLARPFAQGENFYVERIRQNLERLQRELETASV